MALCGFSREVPGNWPEGHRWVSVDPGTMLAIEPVVLDVFCKDCLPLVCGPDILTIHLLHSESGRPLCGFEAVGFEWPPGHTGAYLTDQRMNPNCPACLASAMDRALKTRWDHIRENAADEGDT